MQMKQRWLLSASMVVVLLLSSANTVAACTYTTLPVPWILATPTFDKSVLPNGITMTYRKPEGWGDGELLLTNASSTPLYVLAKAENVSMGTRPNEHVPDGQVATMKLVKNSWSRYVDGPWETVRSEDAPRDAWTASLSELGIETYPKVSSPELADRVIPPPLQTTLTLLYGEQVISIPTTVEFAPNPGYDPSPRDYGNPCSPMSHIEGVLPWVAAVIVVVCVAGGIWLRRPA